MPRLPRAGGQVRGLRGPADPRDGLRRCAVDADGDGGGQDGRGQKARPGTRTTTTCPSAACRRRRRCGGPGRARCHRDGVGRHRQRHRRRRPAGDLVLRAGVERALPATVQKLPASAAEPAPGLDRKVGTSARKRTRPSSRTARGYRALTAPRGSKSRPARRSMASVSRSAMAQPSDRLGQQDMRSASLSTATRQTRHCQIPRGASDLSTGTGHEDARAKSAGSRS